MKLDLHCHTKKTKIGDAETRNVTKEFFRETLLTNDIKICAITNHNHFDRKQFDEFSNFTKGEIILFPGIELDVEGLHRNGHVVVVANPKQLNEFCTLTSELLDDIHPDQVLININNLLKYVNSLDCIVLAHYNKAKSLDEESLDLIKEKIEDKSRFFYEPSTYRSLGIFNNHGYYSLLGSDVKDWEKYNENEVAELKLQVDSFEQLIRLIKKDSIIVETLLKRKTKYDIDIAYKNGSLKEIVPIYDDVNIIFGAKGTGKSESLNKIKAFFRNKNIDFSYYTPNNSEDKITSKLDVYSYERKLENYGLNNREDNFTELRNWKESSFTSLKDYRDAVETESKNEMKKFMKIINTPVYQGNLDIELNKIKNDRKEINAGINKLVKVDLSKYLLEDERITLNTILGKLKKSAYCKYEEEWITYESKQQANNSIESIKELVEEKTETKLMPSNTGLYDFINSRLSLYSSLKKIKEGFEFESNDTPIFIGDLGDNKKLYTVKKSAMLNNKSKKEEFEIGIKKLQRIKKELFDLDFFEMDINSCISSLKDEMAEYEITNLDDFFGVNKVFTLSIDDLKNIETYVPSTGEATIILLHEKLNEDKNVFILDEPEKSLGNTYVNDVVVPKIISLSKQKKVVVIATHNANIAVRTLPYTSILKTYSNGIYNTYIGNPFTNRLVPINDGLDNLEWKEESIRVLEGGREAFEERGEIYNG